MAYVPWVRQKPAFSNPVIAMQDQIVLMLKHFDKPEHKAVRLSEKIAEAYLRGYPNTALMLFSYTRALENANWRTLPASAVVPLFEHFPSRTAESKLVRLYEHSWPLELTAQLIDNAMGASIRFEPVAIGHDRKCDLFVHGRLPPDQLISMWHATSGDVLGGIAIECKALSSESRSSLEGHLDHAATQLAPYNGGVVAVDVSAIVSRSIDQHAPEDVFYRQVTIKHEQLHDVLYEISLKKSAKWKRSIKAITVRCRLSCPAKMHVDEFEYYTLYDYNRSFGFTIDSSLNANNDTAVILNKYFGDMSGVYFLPRKGDLFAIHPGETLWLDAGTHLPWPNMRLTYSEPMHVNSLKLVANIEPGKPLPVLMPMQYVNIIGQPGSAQWMANIRVAFS